MATRLEGSRRKALGIASIKTSQNPQAESRIFLISNSVNNSRTHRQTNPKQPKNRFRKKWLTTNLLVCSHLHLTSFRIRLQTPFANPPNRARRPPQRRPAGPARRHGRVRARQGRPGASRQGGRPDRRHFWRQLRRQLRHPGCCPPGRRWPSQGRSTGSALEAEPVNLLHSCSLGRKGRGDMMGYM